MTAKEDLIQGSTHFAFGKNWSSYSELVAGPHIASAAKELARLVSAEEMRGKAFLDIGCGSGLHALAAARLGAASLALVDIDADSVATARAVLSRHNPGVPWRAGRQSVFDLDPERDGMFDVVYSWGVLHHTGAMWDAVRHASTMVAAGGLLAIALYRKTSLDPFWKWEKRHYAHARPAVQSAVARLFISAFALGLTATGRSYRAYVADYKSQRGMDHRHDVHDWLGGWPYEAALAPEVDEFIGPLGFTLEGSFARPKSFGLFGSGCDEYVYRRTGS